MTPFYSTSIQTGYNITNMEGNVKKRIPITPISPTSNLTDHKTNMVTNVS